MSSIQTLVFSPLPGLYTPNWRAVRPFPRPGFRQRPEEMSEETAPRPGQGPRRSRSEYMAEASVELLGQAQSGDATALDVLCQRYLPRLERWASGRLPQRARDLVETGDIVQETVVRMLRQVDRFEVRREGALLAYLRSGIMNRIRDEARRVGRRPDQIDVDDVITEAPDKSALEELIGREAIESYERALATLRDRDREAIVARLELDMSFEEIAAAIGKDSANTARMTFNRALLRLAEEMARAS